jgi:hypothetical protein
MSKKIQVFVFVSVLVSLLTACGSRGFKQSYVININGDIFVITMAINPIDGVDSIEKRHVPNPDTLDALGISRTVIDNKGYNVPELEEIPLGLDIPDVNLDYRGFVEFKDKYFPDTIPFKPGGVGQTETRVIGKLGEVRARTTSFEVGKGETIDIPVLVTSSSANLIEVWFPIGGYDKCPGGYADVYPSGSIVVGSTIQLQLSGGNVIGTCQTTLNVTLYINDPPTEPIIEEFSIPITITVTE